MHNIKQVHLCTVNDEVQIALQRVLSSKSLEDAQRLEKLMDIQSKVEGLKEFPFGSQGAVTFLVTLVTASTQIAAVSVIRSWKP